MTDWRQTLRETRHALSLTQAELASKAGVSEETIRAYELGRRAPRRQHLAAIVEAMQLDRASRNEILTSAGFAADGLDQRPQNIGAWMFTPDEASTEIASYPWPAFVLTERAQVVAANALVQRVWGVDMERDYPDPLERNMLAVASDPRFADHCLNWDQVVAVLVGNFKSYHRRPESVDEPSPYFAAALNRFLQGDPRYVGRFAKLWEEAPESLGAKIRWSYPIVWSIDGIGVMRFRGTASAANETDGLSFHDWIPVDATTWLALDMLLKTQPVGPAGTMPTGRCDR